MVLNMLHEVLSLLHLHCQHSRSIYMFPFLFLRYNIHDQLQIVEMFLERKGGMGERG